MFEVDALFLFLPLSLPHTHTISLFPSISHCHSLIHTNEFSLSHILSHSLNHTHTHTYTHSPRLAPKYKHLSFLTHPHLFSPILMSPHSCFAITTPHYTTQALQLC